MLSLSRFIFYAGVLAVGLTSVHGLTDEESAAIVKVVHPFVEECGKEHGISEADIKAAKEAGTLKDLSPCALSCVLKKLGIINEKGMFDEAKTTELADKFVPNEEEKKKAFEFVQTCAAVNEKPVTDGESGCERAKLVLECYLPLKG